MFPIHRICFTIDCQWILGPDLSGLWIEGQEHRRQELIELFDLVGHEDETLESFSHGMRQKTIIIGALLPDPDIWILDEPLQGLDPQAAFDLKEMIKRHAEKGNTVIFLPMF